MFQLQDEIFLDWQRSTMNWPLYTECIYFAKKQQFILQPFRAIYVGTPNAKSLENHVDLKSAFEDTTVHYN